MKNEHSKQEQLVLRLPTELRDAVEHAAAVEGRSLSNMARRIIAGWAAQQHEHV
jgi:uncharacterized protein (DUF1778 family)